jgi:Cupin superfamily protein
VEHRLVTAIEEALRWDGPGALGHEFARGHLADPDLPQRLMTPTGLLDLVMRRHLGYPQLRCFAEGQDLHTSRYLSEVVNRRRQAFRQVDMAALGAVLRGGGTMVLDSVSVFDPTLEVACRALGWWAGELVSVNAYLAAGDTPGFNLHWDDHDVICVQLAGHKSWEVRGASRPVPMYRDSERNPTPPEEVVWSGTMEPGDVMQIPRGHWHAATRTGSGDGCSLHLTFGITKRTGTTWISYLSDAARAHDLFRTDLETKDGPADAQILALRLAQLAKEHDPASYRAHVWANTPAARHVPYVPALGPLEAVAAITEYEPDITTTGDRVEVVAAGKKLTFAGRAEPALRVLLSGHPVPLQAADPDTQELARLLVEEGLCTTLSDESSSGYTGLLSPVTLSKVLSTSA